MAKKTTHVTTGRTHAEHARSWQEMIQRFLFNGIDLQRSGRTIAQAVEFSALINSNEAKPRLARMNVTVPRTEVTVHASASLRLPPASFVQFVGFLEDL